MKKLVIGILAHVDAGKTTLAESLLYHTGSIRKLGRVDHKNAFLDNHELERERGITIFSKQAVFTYNDMLVTLLDTPGHVDFSAEMERTLHVLDYAILVISGSEGIQGHTETLWHLLCRYAIPTFIFVNKMDLEGTDKAKLMAELKKALDEGCVDFSAGQEPAQLMENLAVYDDGLFHAYMENGMIDDSDIAGLIQDRKVFPCYFGSALRQEGVAEFLSGLEKYTLIKHYPDTFGAKVYKIARDERGSRLTFMKITGGSLKVKTALSNRKNSDDLYNYGEPQDTWEEKADQIRIYSGSKYETADEVEAGRVCAVTGLTRTFPGQGLGTEEDMAMPVLKPVLTYQLILPPQCSAFQMLSKLRELEDEDPTLHIVWHEKLQEIHIQLMGEVQVEILKNLIAERFGVTVEFGPGNILYKETIMKPVVGVGHFEPLRHYAEVHLLLEPGKPGSGLKFESVCSEDMLDRNWQRLILTHLGEKEHVGVLTGSPITDMKITLLTGRYHNKHTEGGDFRQATYRAVRHGLKKAESVLLEPYYNFRLKIPADAVGRAMTDIQQMNGSFEPPQIEGDMAVISGLCPVATMSGYHLEVKAYTRGRGVLSCSPAGYLPCHNEKEVIEKIGYDSEADIENPTGSVFCSHGTSFIVPWDRVEDYKHVEVDIKELYKYGINEETRETENAVPDRDMESKPSKNKADSWQEDKELEEIFTRTYGPIKKSVLYTPSRLGYERKPEDAPAHDAGGRQDNKATESGNANNGNTGKTGNTGSTLRGKPGQNASKNSMDARSGEPVKEYLLVDGYNIIFSWDELNELAKANMDAARLKLMDILSNYQGYKKCTLILVFDAYKVKGGVGSVQKYHNIDVVYTKEAETADQYIEKVAHEIAKSNSVTVATSDALEQLIIMSKGATRMSARAFREEILKTNEEMRRFFT